MKAHPKHCPCWKCELLRVRVDLATRDRELAEARADATLNWKLCEQARAALAEKEREVAEATATGLKLMRMLAAAQEEAKGLRAALQPFARCGFRTDEVTGCGICAGCVAVRALAASQQQPDGKPDPAPVASAADILAIACPHCRAPAGQTCNGGGLVCAVRIRAARKDRP